MDIEVELKEERPLVGDGYICLCDKPATRLVTVGRVENHYGTMFAICDSEKCLEATMDDYIDEIQSMRIYRKELAAFERFEYEKENHL